MKITQANPQHVESLAQLFDAYRQFYRQPEDYSACLAFITERLQKNDSVVFIAEFEAAIVGFVQLYPSFTSVGMGKIFVLNDLFVSKNARGQGVASALMNHAASFAKNSGAKRLDLATEKTNASAQALYEKMGWVKEDAYYHYSLAIGV